MRLKTAFTDEETGRTDWHVVLFLVNVFLVVLGYSTRGATFQVVKAGRIAVVVISLLGLFFFAGRPRYVFGAPKNWVLWMFILLNLYTLAFSVNFLKSLGRIAAWLPFLVYINYFIVYLFRRYEKTAVQARLLQLFGLVYLYPLLITFALANPLALGNLYGATIGGFKSNVLGWAAVAFFVTAVDQVNNYRLTGWYKRLLLGVAVLGLPTLAATGSRSSYLCLALSLVLLVVNSKKVKFLAKVLMTILMVGLSYYSLTDPESAVNKRIQKSEQQLEKGESRFQMAEIALETMIENPLLLLTGFGYDNFQEGIAHYRGIEFELRSHNSYLELFITTGSSPSCSSWCSWCSTPLSGTCSSTAAGSFSCPPS
jgi:O-antigen ligase